MLMLPMELEAAVLSPLPHALCMFTFGEFMSIEFDRGLRDGILMPFCVIVGDESGDDCSGSVEWWRCVHALENSAPRDRRGSNEAGDAYVLCASSWGESGTRAAKCAGLGMGTSRGICRERPRDKNSGRRGVVGCAWWSSFDMRAGGSRNFGDGSRRGVLSDSDRDFDFWGVRASSVPMDPSSRRLLLPVSGAIAALSIVICEHFVTPGHFHSSMNAVRRGRMADRKIGEAPVHKACGEVN